MLPSVSVSSRSVDLVGVPRSTATGLVPTTNLSAVLLEASRTAFVVSHVISEASSVVSEAFTVVYDTSTLISEAFTIVSVASSFVSEASSVVSVAFLDASRVSNFGKINAAVVVECT